MKIKLIQFGLIAFLSYSQVYCQTNTPKNPTNLIVDSALIFKTLHPDFPIKEYLIKTLTKGFNDTILKENYQSKYYLGGVKIVDDYLEFNVTYRGIVYDDTTFTSSLLLWDGKYKVDDDSIYVNLYFSFKAFELFSA